MEHNFSFRKMMAVLLVAVLAFGVLWMPSPAKAAGDNMEMTVEFSPTSLSSSGEVEVRAVVSNRGDDVTNVTVTVGDRQIASWSSFIAGNSDAAEYSYTVKDSEIGSNIPVVLSYEYNGETKKISKSFKVAKKEANVKVSTAVKVIKMSCLRRQKLSLLLSWRTRAIRPSRTARFPHRCSMAARPSARHFLSRREMSNISPIPARS